jgi:hypothetical protein
MTALQLKVSHSAALSPLQVGETTAAERKRRRNRPFLSVGKAALRYEAAGGRKFSRNPEVPHKGSPERIALKSRC